MEKVNLELLKDIRLLHEEYQKSIEGRKDIVKEIREKVKDVRKKTGVFNPELDEIEGYYRYRDYYISDYKVAMNLLFRLANETDGKYAMKEITTMDFYDTSMGYQKLKSKVLFIANESLMDLFSNDYYYHDGFKKIANYAINKGGSMIVITSNLFEPNVKPRKDEVKCDDVLDIRNGGLLGNITCYINGLNMKEAVDKFVNYVDLNGPDFSNIDEDTLFEIMNNTKIAKKTLK